MKMNSYFVHRMDVTHPNASFKYEITGDDLIDAVKRYFSKVLKVSCRNHVPFRYPMEARAQYDRGIIGGAGGIEIRLEWKYSPFSNREGEIMTHSIWMYGTPEDLPETKEWTVIEGN